MSPLVESLRTQGENALRRHLSLGMHKLCTEAADEIERLRKALEPFANRARHLTDADPDSFTAWHPAVGSPVSAGDLRAALAAIDERRAA